MKPPAIDYYIIATINEQEKHFKVVQLQTTEDVPCYACFIGETEIRQLRKETYGKWEKLWGNLDNNTIQFIGSQIMEKTTPP
ncbi:hypothetical protein [Pedobacter sp.]